MNRKSRGRDGPRCLPKWLASTGTGTKGRTPCADGFVPVISPFPPQPLQDARAAPLCLLKVSPTSECDGGRTATGRRRFRGLC